VFCQALQVSVTTAVGGAATAYTERPVNGRVLKVIYTKHGTTPFADGVDFTITTETTAQNVWVESNVNASKAVAPRDPTHDTAGVASLYAAAGEPVEGYVWAADERIKIVIAAGGDAKLGTFTVIVG
jgi:hypothetical protein